MYKMKEKSIVKKTKKFHIQFSARNFMYVWFFIINNQVSKKFHYLSNKSFFIYFFRSWPYSKFSLFSYF